MTSIIITFVILTLLVWSVHQAHNYLFDQYANHSIGKQYKGDHERLRLAEQEAEEAIRTLTESASQEMLDTVLQERIKTAAQLWHEQKAHDSNTGNNPLDKGETS